MAVKYSGLKEYVYKEIKDRLINNIIKPGERIWEEKIAEDLEVSRTPVREAISKLIAEGFIKNEPRKGIFAVKISNSELEKLLDIRIALETLAVKLACENITDDEIVELKSILERYSKKLSNGEYMEASQLDSRIHRFIAGASRNSKLEVYINDIQDMFSYTRAFNVYWSLQEKEIAINNHIKVIEAIEKRDKEAAVVGIKNDIEAMRDLLHKGSS